MVILSLILSHYKTKDQIVFFFIKPKDQKTWGSFVWEPVASMEFSRERRSSFSLEIRAIGQLDFDGARRENVLRGAGYAWTPGLRVFDNSKR